MATHKAIKTAIQMLLAENLRNGPDNEQRVEATAGLWARILCDLSDVDLEQAVLAYIRGSEPWWPRIGVILSLVPRRKLVALPGSADAVWEECKKMCSFFGSYRAKEADEHLLKFGPWRQSASVDHTESEKQAARDALSSVGGFLGMCSMDNERETYVRASFRKVYDASFARSKTLTEVREVRALSTGLATRGDLVATRGRIASGGEGAS